MLISHNHNLQHFVPFFRFKLNLYDALNIALNIASMLTIYLTLEAVNLKETITSLDKM